MFVSGNSGEMGRGHVRQVGGDVARADGDFSVLHVFRVHEQDVVDQAEVAQQDRADQAVEIAAGDESELFVSECFVNG